MCGQSVCGRPCKTIEIEVTCSTARAAVVSPPRLKVTVHATQHSFARVSLGWRDDRGSARTIAARLAFIAFCIRRLLYGYYSMILWIVDFCNLLPQTTAS